MVTIELKTFQEQAMFGTVRIVTPVEGDPSGASVGTGFFLVADLPDQMKKVGENKSSVTLLISNKHVFASTKDMRILYHARQKDRALPDWGHVIKHEVGDYSHVYYEHPDPEVDLACINASQASVDPRVYHKALLIENIADFTEEKLLPGKDVMFVGYPGGRQDLAHNLPLLRKGYIASHPKLDFCGAPIFVIDAHVHPGSSGSPVFALLDDKATLIGVITQELVRKQLVDKPLRNITFEIGLGLGIVIKATKVRELVDHALATIAEDIDDSPYELEDDPWWHGFNPDGTLRTHPT